MFPVILSIGPIVISTFGVFLAMSFIIGTFMVWHYGKEEVGNEKILDLILLLTITAIITGRIFFILANPLVFEGNFLKMLHLINFPGIYWSWGFIASLLIGIFYCRQQKINYKAVLDASVPGLALSLFLSQIGCFFGGCEIGTETNFFLGIEHIKGLGKRHPISLYEALIMIIIFILIYFLFQKKLKKKNQSKKSWNENDNGQISIVFILLLGVSSFLLEFLKESSVYLFSLKITQYPYLILIILGIIYLGKNLSINKVKEKLFKTKQELDNKPS